MESAAGLGVFDRILAINTGHAWKERVEAFAGLREALRPGGRMVIVEQPRGLNATDSQARHMADLLEGDIRGAGFGEVSTAELQIEPVAIAVIGVV